MAGRAAMSFSPQNNFQNVLLYAQNCLRPLIFCMFSPPPPPLHPRKHLSPSICNMLRGPGTERMYMSVSTVCYILRGVGSMKGREQPFTEGMKMASGASESRKENRVRGYQIRNFCCQSLQYHLKQQTNNILLLY